MSDCPKKYLKYKHKCRFIYGKVQCGQNDVGKMDIQELTDYLKQVKKLHKLSKECYLLRSDYRDSCIKKEDRDIGHEYAIKDAEKYSEQCDKSISQIQKRFDEIAKDFSIRKTLNDELFEISSDYTSLTDSSDLNSPSSPMSPMSPSSRNKHKHKRKNKNKIKKNKPSFNSEVYVSSDYSFLDTVESPQEEELDKDIDELVLQFKTMENSVRKRIVKHLHEKEQYLNMIVNVVTKRLIFDIMSKQKEDLTLDEAIKVNELINTIEIRKVLEILADNETCLIYISDEGKESEYIRLNIITESGKNLGVIYPLNDSLAEFYKNINENLGEMITHYMIFTDPIYINIISSIKNIDFLITLNKSKGLVEDVYKNLDELKLYIRFRSNKFKQNNEKNFSSSLQEMIDSNIEARKVEYISRLVRYLKDEKQNSNQNEVV